MHDRGFSLATYVIGATRAAVLRALFRDRTAELHVRALARITGASPGSLHRELRALAEHGLLARREEGRHVLYRANTDSPAFPALSSLLLPPDSTTPSVGDPGAARAAAQGRRRPSARASARPRVSRRRLAALCRKHHVRKLSLFGSAARGDAGPESDVDLIVEFAPGRAPSYWSSGGLEADLSALFGHRRVEIASPEILRNPYRRRAIEPELEVLYEARAA